MMDGELLQVDTPGKVYSDPSDIRVAEFIGSPKINILPGQVDGRGMISVGDRILAGVYSSEKGKDIKVGVRPEAMTLEGINAEGLPCRIVHNEYLGSEAFFHAELNIGGKIISRMDASALDRFSTGHEATAVIDPRNALLFGLEGQRITSKIEMVA
jgi:multiple sugar transport system ATP-binding protein